MNEEELLERLVAVERDQVALDRLIAALRVEDHRAIEMAQRALDSRLTSMNEFRRLIEEQQGSFLTREEYDLHHGQLENELESHREEAGRRFDEVWTELGNQRSLRIAIAILIPVLVAILGAILLHTYAG